MAFRRGRRLLRLSTAIAAVGLAVAGAAGCSSSSSSTASTSAESGSGSGAMTNITVDTLAGDGAAPLWIAQKNGYFKQQGLNVKVVFAQGASTEFTDLAGHAAQFVEGNYVTMLQAMAKSKDAAGLRIVADNVRPGANTNDLMVSSSSKITSVAQLKGKPVAFPSAGLASADISLSQQLEGNGIAPNAYTIVPMAFANMAAALKSGTIAAAFAVQPYITQMEAKDGDHELLDLMAGDNETLPLEGWMTNTAYLQSNAQTVAAFQRAIVKAQTTAASDPTLVRQLLPQNIKGMTQQTANVMALRTFSSTITATELDRVVVGMQQLGDLPKSFAYNNLIMPLPSAS